MKSVSIQSLAFAGLGALLGFVAATRNISPSLHAGESPSASRQPVANVGTVAAGGAETSCCTEGVGKGLLLAQAGAVTTTSAPKADPASAAKKPNIVFIMGDDIGWFNIGAYHRGMMA